MVGGISRPAILEIPFVEGVRPPANIIFGEAVR